MKKFLIDNLPELIALVISLTSIIFSVITYINNLKYRKINLFLERRAIILDLINSADLPLSKQIDFWNNPESDEAIDQKNKNYSIYRRVRKEFDILCKLYLENKIDKSLFENYYFGWLIGAKLKLNRGNKEFLNYNYTCELVRIFDKKNKFDSYDL